MSEGIYRRDSRRRTFLYQLPTPVTHCNLLLLSRRSAVNDLRNNAYSGSQDCASWAWHQAQLLAGVGVVAEVALYWDRCRWAYEIGEAERSLADSYQELCTAPK